MRYQVLGPVSVLADSGPLRLGGPKQRAVLASLLLRANQVVSDEQLCSLVWGEQAPANVRGQLQIYVSGLRKVLGRDTIVRRPPGYLIEVAPGELDLEVFSTTVEAAVADLAAGQAERASGLLRTALDLWKGPALGGVPDSLVEREGQGLEDQRLAAYEHYFDAELLLARPTSLIGDLRRLVREYPFREQLGGQLMLALYRSGRASEALAAYAQIRFTLAAELGIDPGTRLQELHQRILRGEEAGRPVATAEPPVAVTPAELPHDIDDFIGRDAELAELTTELADLADGTLRIRVISGMAGVGKTALAVRWAHRVRAEFPDGQLYVDLHGFTPRQRPSAPEAVLGQVLRVLGVPAGKIPSQGDELGRLYRSMLSSRRMLLVLDNAFDAEQVRALLPGRSTMVLVTSRNRLRDLLVRDGARACTLRPLPEGDSEALLGRLIGTRRVAAEPEAAAELARRCGHLPLALRIAAAELGGDPIATLLSEVDDIGALTVDGAEHSSVAASFALSYDSVSPELQRAFLRLRLTSGAITVASLDCLEPAEARRRLRALAAANLVEQRDRGRYRLHELARSFAMNLVGLHSRVRGGGDGFEWQPDRRHRPQLDVVL